VNEPGINGKVLRSEHGSGKPGKKDRTTLRLIEGIRNDGRKRFSRLVAQVHKPALALRDLPMRGDV
jgi:hypothetical protein